MADKKFDLSVIMRVIDKASRPLKEVARGFKGISKDVTTATKKLQRLQSSLRKVSRDMKDVGKSLALKVTLPIATMGFMAVRTAIKFESAFTGVKKTVEASAEQFAVLKKGLMEMAKVIPISTEEIFGIAEAAGQLGIKQEDILAFTKVMADLGATTNITAQDAAMSLAKFANVVGVPTKDMEKLGSVIVELGNNTATTEADIVSMAGRLAKAGKFANISAAEIMGLAAGLTSIGIEAEAGGSAVQRVLFDIGKEIDTESQKMKDFSFVAGMSVKDFRKLFKEDAAQAVLTFADGLSKLEAKGINVAGALDQLGMDGVRVALVLLGMSSASEKFDTALKMSKKEWIDHNALLKEANMRYATTESRLIMAKERARQLSATFGDVMLPGLLKVIRVLEPMTNAISKLDGSTKAAIIGVAAYAAVLGPLAIVIGTIVGFFGAAALAPVLAATAAFVGLGAALYQTIKHWKELKLLWDDWSKFVQINNLTNLKQWGPKIDKFVAGPQKYGGSEQDYQGEQAKFGWMSKYRKSETDINLKVTTDPGTTVTVERVKPKRGDANVTMGTVGFVGAR